MNSKDLLPANDLPQGYFVEHNGDYWQSVFPSWEAEKSQLHTTTKDALIYMTKECGIKRAEIKIIKKQKGA